MRSNHPTCQCRAFYPFTATDIQSDVGVLVEGQPQHLTEQDIETLCADLYTDAIAAVQQAAMVLIESEEGDDEDEDTPPRTSPPGPLELSLVMCDDPYIANLNKEWRGQEGPTDVLSFELDGGEEVVTTYNVVDTDEQQEQQQDGIDSSTSASSDNEEDGIGGEEVAVTLLGDVVISLDTALRQAQERGHSLHDECRILLVHGILHLLGYDHENGTFVFPLFFLFLSARRDAMATEI